MGQEYGTKVTIINYPRYPEDKESLLNKAFALGENITSECNQGSYTVVSPEKTYFFSRRSDEK
jgi:hypothetical protein